MEIVVDTPAAIYIDTAANTGVYTSVEKLINSWSHLDMLIDLRVNKVVRTPVHAVDTAAGAVVDAAVDTTIVK